MCHISRRFIIFKKEKIKLYFALFTSGKRFSKIGGEVLVYDTMKADTSENDSTWLALLNDSKELFQIVSKNNLAGVVTFQLALSTKNKVRILDEGVLSNGKQVAEVFSEMIGFRDIWSDEFSGEDSDIKPYKINYKTKEKEDITIKKGDGYSYKILKLEMTRWEHNFFIGLMDTKINGLNLVNVMFVVKTDIKEVYSS